MAKTSPTVTHQGRFYEALRDEVIECRAIMACDTNGILGYDNDLIFHNPDDMKFFQEKTMGNLVFMGRRTFQSIGAKGLKGRVNVVLTKTPVATREAWEADMKERKEEPSKDAPVWFISSTAQLLEVAKMSERPKIWVIGGGKVYNLMAGYCRSILVTYYRVNLLELGVEYGLLPSGFQRTRLARFGYLPWVRQHPGTLLDSGRLQVHDGNGCNVDIPWNIMAYTMHQTKTAAAAAKALQKDKDQMSAAGYLYKGGKYDRSKHFV